MCACMCIGLGVQQLFQYVDSLLPVRVCCISGRSVMNKTDSVQ